MDIRNEVILYGPVKGELFVRETKGGPLVVFDLNTDPDKRNKYAFEDHRVVCWNNLAVAVENNIEEGDWVLVEGKMQTRTWKNRTGTWMRTTEIIASRVDLVEKRAGLSPDGRMEVESPDIPNLIPQASNGVHDDMPF